MFYFNIRMSSKKATHEDLEQNPILLLNSLMMCCNGSPRLRLVMSTSLTVPGIRQGSLLNSMVGYDLFDPSLNR